MRKIPLIFLIALAILLICGSAIIGDARAATLLTPAGQPVGAPWQTWINESYMPTYQGTIALNTAFDGQCGMVTDARGCTQQETPGSYVIGILPGSAALERETLLYEQAHVIDLEYLTDADRAELIALWRQTVPAGQSVDQFWWDGETYYWWGEPVMGEWFADDYSLCALHRSFTWALMDRANGGWPGADSYPVYDILREPENMETRNGSYRVVWLPPTRRDAYWLQAQEESCALIRYWIEQAYVMR